LGSPQLLRWVYSEAKALDESLAQMFYQSHGLDFVIGRFFNTVGPRQSGMYGMVLPRFVSAALSQETLRIFGNGTQTRTFCHVSDAVDAVVKLYFAENTSGETFNIGGEGEISIKELAKKVITKTSSRSVVDFVDYEKAYPQGFEEMMRRVPDTKKLRTYTGWSPKLDLDQIIEDVKAYLLANKQ
jgi:UDP-glucose 4-epimerase